MIQVLDEMSRRQKAVSDSINTPVIIAGHTAQQRAADMAHQFTQESSFFWLTGINEPDWLAILVDGELRLVSPARDETQLLFDGGISSDDALKMSGASIVYTRADADVYIGELAKHHERVSTIGVDPHGEYHHFEENGARGILTKKLESTFSKIEDARPVFSKLRAIKSEYEITQLQVAIDASIRGFTELKALLENGADYEYELEAVLNSAFRKTGAGGHAYDPIVAAGGNACTLHYGINNDKLYSNDLVLIDAGAKMNGYAADITRTYAIDTPTERQLAVHAAVEHAHRKIIELIKPGFAFKEYQKRVDEIMKDALESIGLLAARDDDEAYHKYFPHAISHGLGLDVHESLGGYKEFQPGMVLTVEPGIYIPEEEIGVRIEDDVLVTETGNTNLSAALSTSL